MLSPDATCSAAPARIPAILAPDNVQRFTLTGADSSDGIHTEGSVRRAGKRKTLYVITLSNTREIRWAGGEIPTEKACQ
jgi:hypothetical protein